MNLGPSDYYSQTFDLHCFNLPISPLCLALLSIVIISPLFSLCLALLSVGGRVEDQPPPVGVANPKCKNNYASVDCGAKVIRHSLEAKVQCTSR